MKDGKVTIELPVGWPEAVLEEAADQDEAQTPRLARVRRLSAAVAALNAISVSLPTTYGWRFITAENFSVHFEKRVADGASPAELNHIYWKDTLATVEAYTVMSVWRMVDICQSAFRCMDEDAIVPCAILARSALESSVQFVQDARTISASLEGVIKHDLKSAIATSRELEEYLLQTVYASRQSGADEIYKSKNILTVLGKIAKIIKDEPIMDEYETLCEVTHPNFLGRSAYLSAGTAERADGSELRVISPANGANGGALLQTALWALSWAIEAQATSTHLVQSTVSDFMKVLPAGYPTS
ncbi:MAG: hypothetical protein ABI216_13450 [Devosia sp.]